MDQDKNRVLIICRDFPPYGSVTSYYIRMLELANFLSDNDYIVDVYCVSRAYKSAKEVLDPEVRVHPLISIYAYFDVVGCKLDNLILKFGCVVTKVFKKLFLKLIRNVIDYESILTQRFYNKIMSEVKDWENVNVITSSPSHSIHLVGEKIKDALGEKVNWIADFRDPWSARPLYGSKQADELEFERKVEARILKKADHFVVVSEGMADYYEKLRGDHVEVIENGYVDATKLEPNPELADFVNKQHEAKRIVLAYFGTGGIGSAGQSGKDLFFLGDFLGEKDEVFESYALVMQGSLVVNKNNWGDRLLVLDSEELSQVRANMGIVDVGLNVYTCIEDADMTVGSKIYELAASNTPTWCLIPNGARSIQRFAKKVGGVLITDPLNKEQVIDDAMKIIDKFKDNDDFFKIDTSGLTDYKRSSQYKKFLILMN